MREKVIVQNDLLVARVNKLDHLRQTVTQSWRMGRRDTRWSFPREIFHACHGRRAVISRSARLTQRDSNGLHTSVSAYGSRVLHCRDFLRGVYQVVSRDNVLITGRACTALLIKIEGADREPLDSR